MNGNMDYLLRIEGVNKSFGITRANKDINLQVRCGEIHGIAGENGSGKSTLLSIIAGIYLKDTGKMFVNEQPYEPASPLDANNRGISMVVQEMGLVNNLPAGINIFLGRTQQFTKFGILNTRKLQQKADACTKKWNLPPIRFDRLPELMSVEEKKIIEFVRALSTEPKILILDEITQALSLDNRDRLYNVIREFAADGGTVIMITHDIEEMVTISDTITVLRDGEVIGTVEADNVTADQVKSMMIGRDIKNDYYRDDLDVMYEDEVILEANGITSREGAFENVSFELHKGEILGLCGLSDSGIHSIGQALFGLEPLLCGSIVLHCIGTEIRNHMQAQHSGMAYVPKDRDREALMMKTTIQENICLPSIEKIEGRVGFLSTAKMHEMAKNVTKMYDIKCKSVDQVVGDLSGGNKQKVNLGRWLVKDLNVLIMDSPTRGVDVGVKAYIYFLMKEAKEKGLPIVLISDELTEVIGMADRLIVMKNGEVARIIRRDEDISEQVIIEVML